MEGKRLFWAMSFLGLLLISLIACGGGGSSDGGNNSSGSIPTVIPQTTKVLDNTVIQKIASISADNTTITFLDNTTKLSPGDIVVLGISSVAPNGLIRKVESTSIAGNQLVVQTSQATVTDAVQSGQLQVTKNLTASDIQTTSDFVGGISKSMQRINFQETGVNLQQAGATLSYTLTNSALADGVMANGSFEMSIGFDFNLKVQDWKLKNLSFISTATGSSGVSVTVGGSKAISEKYHLKQIVFNTFEVQIGWLPVVITPIVDLYIGLDGSVSASISTGVTQTVSLTAGLIYDNGSWTPQSSLSKDFVYTPPSLSANANMKIFVGPRLTLRLYGVVGPWTEIDPYLRLNADLNSNPWWSLYGGVSATVGIEVSALGRDIANYNTVVIDESKVLAQAPLTTQPNTPTGLTVTATSSSQIDLSWTAATGTVTGYKIYKNGTYLKSVTATSASDTGLSPSTNYCYSVTVYNAAGESAQASQLCALTQATTSLSLNGQWSFTQIYTYDCEPLGTKAGTITITQQDASHFTFPTALNSGTLPANGVGTISGNNVTFDIEASGSPQDTGPVYTGTVSSSFEHMFGTFRNGTGNTWCSFGGNWTASKL